MAEDDFAGAPCGGHGIVISLWGNAGEQFGALFAPDFFPQEVVQEHDQHKPCIKFFSPAQQSLQPSPNGSPVSAGKVVCGAAGIAKAPVIQMREFPLDVADALLRGEVAYIAGEHAAQHA